MNQNLHDQYFRFSYIDGGVVSTLIGFSFTRPKESPLLFNGFKIRTVDDSNLTQVLPEQHFRLSHIGGGKVENIN